MKRLSYLILLSLFISCSEDEPTNYQRDGEEVFDSMERLQDLAFVTTFIGDLRIEGDDITSLEGLRLLKTIKGNLIISRADELESLEGLNNLRYVEGITLFNSERLSNIDALSGVTNTELLKLQTLPSLTSLEGLGNLHVENTIIISFLPQLTEIGNNITINGEDAYNVYIARMDNLINADFIKDVTETDYMWLSDNPKLEVNGAFTNLKRADIFHLKNNDMLTNLSLNQLNHFNNFHLEENQNLVSVSVDGDELMSHLPFYEPDITFRRNEKLTEISGFNNIPKARLFVFGHNFLTSISGFSSMEEVSLIIRENPSLNSLDLFSENSMSVLEFNFYNNSSLNDFCGLNAALNTDLGNGYVIIEQNGFNPTVEMLNSGDCSPE